MDRTLHSISTIDRELMHFEFQVLKTKGTRRRFGNFETFAEPHFVASPARSDRDYFKTLLSKVR